MQPGLSQTAIAMGMHVGDALVRRAEGKPAKPFSFHDKGYIISLGKHSSVLDLFGVPMSGKLAWLLWAGAYLVKMVGFRKQVEVGIDHLTHLWFEHDTSQILNRRVVLSDDELNLALADTGHAAPASPGGHEANPVQALLATIVACSAMDVVEILRKKRLVLTAYEVRMTGERSAHHPRRYLAIHYVHRLTGRGLKRQAVEHALALSLEKYCSVSHCLRPDLPVTHTIEIHEA